MRNIMLSFRILGIKPGKLGGYLSHRQNLANKFHSESLTPTDLPEASYIAPKGLAPKVSQFRFLSNYFYVNKH